MKVAKTGKARADRGGSFEEVGEKPVCDDLWVEKTQLTFDLSKDPTKKCTTVQITITAEDTINLMIGLTKGLMQDNSSLRSELLSKYIEVKTLTAEREEWEKVSKSKVLPSNPVTNVLQ